MHSIGPSELVIMSIIYLYYNARMYGGGLKEMPCFRTHIKLVGAMYVHTRSQHKIIVPTGGAGKVIGR